MKKAALLIFVLFCAAPAFAQTVGTNQWFPLVTVGGDPNGLHYDTLVQISNNSSSYETGLITVYSDAGAAMSVSFNGGAPATSFNVVMTTGTTQQIQITATGTITNGAWLQITYNPDNNSGGAETTVISQYLSGSTILSEVGINPSYGDMTGAPATIFPVETNISANLNTGIAIANPNVAQVVLAQLVSGTTVIASTTISLPQYGHTAKLLTDLFPTVTGISQMTAELALTSCTTTACPTPGNGPGLIATALRLNIATGLFTAAPVIPTPSGGTITRNIPHIAFGGSPSGINFQTVLYLTNPSSAGVTGQAYIYDNNGNPLAASANGGAPTSNFPFTVLAGTVFKISLSGGSTLQQGWVQLVLPSTSTSLIVNALFQTYNGTTEISEASVLDSGTQQEGLINVNLTPGITNVGVALANPSTVNSNTIALTLYNSAGFTNSSMQYIVTLPPLGHLAQYVTQMFPQLVGASFTGSLSIQTQSGLDFSSVALRQNGTSAVGFAAIPVDPFNVMFVPAITNVAVNSTNRTVAGGAVTFTMSVIDNSPNLVTTTSTAITVGVGILYPNLKSVQGTSYPQGCFDGYNAILVDGTALLNSPTGNLTASFEGGSTCYPTSLVPSGTSAVLYVILEDSLGNFSNQNTVPFKF